jgi:hypothetical protein
MNLTVILTRHNNKEIVDRLFELYPEEMKSTPGYRRVLKTLRSLEPVQRDNMKIDVSHVIDDTDPEETFEYENVSGVVDGEDMSYAIEYTPWEQWLGMHFTAASLKYPEIDLIAHCLWEMTWSGFDQEEIQKTYSGFVEAAKEIENGLKEKGPE